MTWRARAFVGWLLLACGVPALGQFVPDAPPWVAWLPWCGFLVALGSVAVVVPPRGFHPLSWLADIAAAAAAVLPSRPAVPPSPEKEKSP